MLNDLRIAFRNLGRTPAFSLVIIITMALAIGATSAIFSVVDALLFKPLPYPESDRLYAVALANDDPRGFQFWPYPKYAALASEQRIFASTAAYAQTTVTIAAGVQPQRVQAEVVTASYFALLGASPSLGRAFLDAENQVASRDAVLLLSDGLWRRAFGADPQVIGRALVVKDRLYEIVGVMPPSFRGQTGTAELWLPVMMADHFMYQGAASGESSWWLRVVARLKADVTGAAAMTQLPALTARVAQISEARLKSAMRDGRELFQMIPLKTIKVDPGISRSFVMLLSMVVVVLFIACANTAHLLLGRAVVRQKEFALRRALGASTRNLTRQMAAEILLLAAAAGTAALLIATWTLDWLSTAKPMNTTGFWSQYASTFDYFDVSLDARVVVFNVAIALITGLVCGLFPVRHATAVDLHESLKKGAGATVPGVHGGTVRGGLVLAEIAFSLVLLVSAGLMVRSFVRAASADLGFEPAGIVTATVSATERKPAAFFLELVDSVRTIPGVEEAALATGVPVSGGTSRGPMTIEGRAQTTGRVPAGLNVVTPGFFSTFHIQLRAGRLLSDDDRDTTARVAVVSRSFADAAWPGQDPIGHRLKHVFRVANGDPDAWTTVVGVVDDVTYGALEDPREHMIYLPAGQPLGTPAAMALAPATIAVRTAAGAAAVLPALRARVQVLDPSAPLHDIASMEERVARLTARYRYSSAMMGAMGVLALGLAAVGLYAVMAYAVASRTREIGIRVALGARPADVLSVVLGSGVKLAIAGVTLGMLGAWAVSRLLTNMLYDVAPNDPVTFAGIPLLLAGVALLASYLPAHRAMRVDPVIALKHDT